MYFNNAATTWPKPECVYETTDRCFRTLSSPNRTAAKGTKQTVNQLRASRAVVADFFSIPKPEQLVFTPSATYSLNLAVRGLAWSADDHVIMSGIEHHAVSRPIRRIAQQRGVTFHVAPYTPETPVDLEFVERTLQTNKVKLIACSMASNVTGDICPITELGALAKQYGAMFLVDAAQGAGLLSCDVDELHADLLAFAGHKGLYGPPGVGGLYVREGVVLGPLAEGGTGGDSGKHEFNADTPLCHEVGTHNLPAVVGLAAGTAWVAEKGVGAIRAHENALAALFADEMRQLGVTVYGNPDPDRRTAVVSCNFGDTPPKDVATWLAEEHDIATRAGFHCAPLAHETIGTAGRGTIRFSFSCFNTSEEVDALVRTIAASPWAAPRDASTPRPDAATV